MVDLKNTTGSHAAAGNDSGIPSLRELGGRAHELRATARAADRFIGGDNVEDHNTGCWLVSCAVALAAEVANDLDRLARELRNGPSDAALGASLVALRKRAHELHATCRAADRFLDEDQRDDRETGGWLVACARRLADGLASAIDDSIGALQRAGLGTGAAAGAVEPIELGVARRIG
jgi:hypothetical protein